MKKSTEVKEKIIETTIKLIRESDGDVASISTRAITNSAGVGVGLLNYHFQTKENLIEICVDRMIKSVVTGFSPILPEMDHAARLKHASKIVADFFMDNPAVVKISMLSDISKPRTDDNTILSAKLVSKALGDMEIPEKEKLLLSFTLTSVMQTLFLRRDQSEELFGYDMNDKLQRDTMMDFLVDSIFGGYSTVNG